MLMNFFSFTHMESNKVTNGNFTWRPSLDHPYPSFGKGKRQAAVLQPMFQAFLYALSQMDVSALKSALGHRMRWSLKSNRDGRHMDMTFNA